uniref:Uncharacterized protein n=1 Tax=Plectus sambesii TaxID=2011161 RepID=A0A914W9H1_9BILA
MYGVGAYSDSSSSARASSTDFVSAPGYQPGQQHVHQTLAATVVNPLVGRYVSPNGDELASAASSVDASSALSSFYAWRSRAGPVTAATTGRTVCSQHVTTAALYAPLGADQSARFEEVADSVRCTT